jgi:tetratricopeptide (TPR) repeat protein
VQVSRNELVWLPLVLAAMALIYLPGLGNPLLFDDALLAEAKFAQDYANPFLVKERMLSYGSFVWLQALLGDGWWKQRLFNFFLHAGVVAALWAFWRELLRHVEPVGENMHRSPALGFAIGFFALNPVAVYAVAYLVQRSILMATLFVVLALWLFAVALARNKPLLHLAALACYALAILSKEHAVLAPLAAVPVYILVARPSAKRLAGLSVLGLAIAAAAAALLVDRYGEIIGKPFDEYSNVYLAQLASLQPGADKNAFQLSIVNQAWLFLHYGVRWLLPVGEWMSINLRPPFPLTATTLPQALGLAGYLATLAGGFFLLLRYRDWRAIAGLSLLLPALLFATEFITVWVQDPFVLYRSYLWAIGVPGLVFITLHGAPGRALLVVGLVVAALLVWQSLDRVFSMSSVDRAWTDAIRKMPDDPRSVGRWFAYLNRGVARVDNRQYNLAMQDFDVSARLGDMGAGLYNRGSLYAANGEHENALLSFDAAEAAGYRLYNLHLSRGLSLVALGRLKEGYPSLVRAYLMDPPSPAKEIVLINLGRTALQLGLHVDAAGQLRQLLALEPDNADARFYLAMALVAGKDYAGALAELEKLPKDKPSGRTHYARALSYYGLQRKEAALAEIDAAIKIGPDTPHLREWRSRIQAMK